MSSANWAQADIFIWSVTYNNINTKMKRVIKLEI